MYLLVAQYEDEKVILASFTDKGAAQAAERLLRETAVEDSDYIYYAGVLVYTGALRIEYVREWQDSLITRYEEV